jgi:hypothetical protein
VLIVATLCYKDRPSHFSKIRCVAIPLNAESQISTLSKHTNGGQAEKETLSIKNSHRKWLSYFFRKCAYQRKRTDGHPT